MTGCDLGPECSHGHWWMSCKASEVVPSAGDDFHAQQGPSHRAVLQQPHCCHFLEGHCRFAAHCRNSHDEDRPVTSCQYGRSCRYGHFDLGLAPSEVRPSRAEPSLATLCCNFLVGRCIFRDCALSHDPDRLVLSCTFGLKCRHGHFNLGRRASEIRPSRPLVTVPVKLQDLSGEWTNTFGDRIWVEEQRQGDTRLVVRQQTAEGERVGTVVQCGEQLHYGLFKLDLTQSSADFLVWVKPERFSYWSRRSESKAESESTRSLDPLERSCRSLPSENEAGNWREEQSGLLEDSQAQEVTDAPSSPASGPAVSTTENRLPTFGLEQEGLTPEEEAPLAQRKSGRNKIHS